jgi:NADPH-dependent curcumin reductase CurA
MARDINRQITLAARPAGAPVAGDFRLVEAEIPKPRPGQVLLKTLYLSLDPYMRGRMSDAKSYATPMALGEVMTGGTVSRVIASEHGGFPVGQIVEGRTGWQEYALSDGSDLRLIDPALAPVSTALGVLGMPGMTAYTGLLTIGKPKPGETVVVAAASGAVGSLVGQIAKLKGARAVGVAGGPEKCRYVVDELGFDACLDHRDPELAAHLAAACPKGIDVYFENVGGAVFNAVLPLLNPFARIPVCGLIAHYNATSLPPGPNLMPLLMRQVLSNRLTIQGFIVFDFADQQEQFLSETGAWLKAGKIRHREDIVDGIEAAPAAFIGLLEGRNFGKLLVRVAPAA